MDIANRFKASLRLTLPIILFLAVLVAAYPPKASQEEPYRSTSARPDGTKAIRTLLEQKGHHVQTWPYSWRRLTSMKGDSLIVIEPQSPDKDETDALRAWVEAGGRLVLFDSDPGRYPWLPVVSADSSEQKRGVIRLMPGAQTYGIGGGQPVQDGQTFEGEVAANVRIGQAANVTPLLGDERGTVAADIRLGQGTVTLVLEPGWLTNRHILQQDHFVMVWPLVRSIQGAIRIDEYHHGIRKNPGMLAVYPHPLLAAFAQIALAVALWLWLRGKRFGPAHVPREWVVRRGDETLLAVASWYERRKCRREALHFHESYLRQQLLERWGVPLSAADAELLHAAGGRWDEGAVRQLERLLLRFSEVRAEAASPAHTYSARQFAQDAELAMSLIRRLDKEC
ncbi:DUF4350 domain-containing protein [Paenibacillus hamazuiensis]|uniref:DUF4350 domain-containing protein n=1 Tax=Paenibacillus hamazuiensis TaxID=2936508 RepID=UPI00200FDA4B|nr:DUF4350 domain-containing protein [Paenibacillus hamazuiensis]